MNAVLQSVHQGSDAPPAAANAHNPQLPQAAAPIEPPGLYRAERTIAERLTRLASGTLPWPWIDADKALPWVEKRIGLGAFRGYWADDERTTGLIRVNDSSRDNKIGEAMSDEDLKAELERLRSENAALKKGAPGGIRMKVRAVLEMAQAVPKANKTNQSRQGLAELFSPAVAFQ